MRNNYAGKAGKGRREPKITQKDYLVLSRLSRLLKKSVDKHLLEQDATILDIGCGEKPYQPFFLGKSSTYIGVDIGTNECADILCDGGTLPFKGNVFSVCLCSQVLEHVDDPQKLINEVFRVVKPDGLLFLSTHGNWPVHGSPHDYWRWTEQGLRRLLANWHIYEICKCGDSAASMIQLLELYIPPGVLGAVATFLLNKLGNLADKIPSFNALLPDMTTNYFVAAKRSELP